MRRAPARCHRLAIFSCSDGAGDVGVVEDDRRRLAAEFEADPLELLAADPGDTAADRRRTGEGHLVDARVPHQGLTGVASAGKTDTTPSGTVGLSSISANQSESSGVSGAGLTTTEQPAIKQE